MLSTICLFFFWWQLDLSTLSALLSKTSSWHIPSDQMIIDVAGTKQDNV